MYIKAKIKHYVFRSYLKKDLKKKKKASHFCLILTVSPSCQVVKYVGYAVFLPFRVHVCLNCVVCMFMNETH